MTGSCVRHDSSSWVEFESGHSDGNSVSICALVLISCVCACVRACVCVAVRTGTFSLRESHVIVCVCVFKCVFVYMEAYCEHLQMHIAV